ncbi:hypothetical protein HK405_010068 [Cladochytrium tenue]|nr:hypothetical protein HK405_010068 [Cladochytrium tenue]
MLYLFLRGQVVATVPEHLRTPQRLEARRAEIERCTRAFEYAPPPSVSTSASGTAAPASAATPAAAVRGGGRGGESSSTLVNDDAGPPALTAGTQGDGAAEGAGARAKYPPDAQSEPSANEDGDPDTAGGGEADEPGDGDRDDDDNDAEECAICYVEYEPGCAMLAMQRCGHEFHAACLDSWLMSCDVGALRCPFCNTPAFEPGSTPTEFPGQIVV